MSSITPLPDDVGTQSLRRANRVPAGTSAVTEIAPYPGIHPARTSLNAQMAAGALSRRFYEQRPQARNTPRRLVDDRREKQRPVLLDTRDHRERRRNERRDEPDEDTKKRGIDIYT